MSAYITAQIGKTEQIKELVAQYRANESGLRRIRRLHGPTAGSPKTQLARCRRETARQAMETAGVAFGSPSTQQLVAALIVERELLWGIHFAPGYRRPSLQAQLTENRKTIKSLIREVACGR